MTAPEIPDSASPYWLRLYGHWIHLQGIMPVVEVKNDRAFNELITVDGYRYVQRAPRGPRTWPLEYRWGTAAATAALESAAYAPGALREQLDNDLSTMLLDTNAAKVNMVDPDLDTIWTDNFAGYSVINVGESPDQPIWKPTYGGSPEDPTIHIPVRAGVIYSLAIWCRRADALASAITVTLNDGTTDPLLVTYNYPGGGLADPVLVHFTFTPPSDGVADIQFDSFSFLATSSGLMVYEGDCVPGYYRMGRRTPCQVSVQDPTISTNLMYGWKGCDPCALPREHAEFVVQEVGVGMLDPTRIPAP